MLHNCHDCAAMEGRPSAHILLLEVNSWHCSHSCCCDCTLVQWAMQEMKNDPDSGLICWIVTVQQSSCTNLAAAVHNDRCQHCLLRSMRNQMTVHSGGCLCKGCVSCRMPYHNHSLWRSGNLAKVRQLAMAAPAHSSAWSGQRHRKLSKSSGRPPYACIHGICPMSRD